jgi:hypothetical protein
METEIKPLASDYIYVGPGGDPSWCNQIGESPPALVIRNVHPTRAITAVTDVISDSGGAIVKTPRTDTLQAQQLIFVACRLYFGVDGEPNKTYNLQLVSATWAS